MPNNDQVMFFLNFSTKLNKLTFFYRQTSNVADDDDEDDTQVTYRSSLPELKKVQLSKSLKRKVAILCQKSLTLILSLSNAP